MDGRQIHDIEAELGDVVEPRLGIAQRAVRAIRAGRAREQLVPRRADGETALDVHDELAVVARRQRAIRCARHGVGVVPGVEIDSGFGGKLWHTLIYGVDPAAPELLALCAAVFERNMASG